MEKNIQASINILDTIQYLKQQSNKKKTPHKNAIDTETEVQSHIHTVDQVNAVFVKDLN